ncbi:MAG: GNAT family N-acetyltransferase [Candidatus Hodarchaeales archaeon]
MSQVKKLPVEDIEAFIDISVKAYPGLYPEGITEERKQRTIDSYKNVQEKVPKINVYGFYRGDQVHGGMILYDYTMKMLSTKVQAGGVGQMAVDLLHKKEHVCKEMMTYYLHHYREKGFTMAILYPFRADFYKQMGFGYGTKMNRYYFEPASLKKGKSRNHLTYLQKEDAISLIDCYNRYVDKTHGMIERSERGMMRVLANPNINVIGYKNDDGSISGYLAFKFDKAKADNFILNDMEIMEFIYESPEVLSEISTFMYTQADQINRIIYDTQDENFHFLLKDARNSSQNMFSTSQETNIQGTGLMYRVINTEKLFGHLCNYDFGHQICKLKLKITDTFLPENNDSLIVHFDNGKATIKEGAIHEVEVKMDISEFSSLIMGVISFKQLYRYGLVELSDIVYLETVNKLFLVEEKPICMTQF